MQIKADEIASILQREIEGFEQTLDVTEVGEVIQVGDGIARVYGLENVKSSELVEFPNGVYGMALNLEEDNVGCILFGNTTLVKEGDEVAISGVNLLKDGQAVIPRGD